MLGSATALNFLKQIVNHEFACRAVTEKDTVDLGGMTLHFLSVPFLHWPDSMYTYIPEAKALFTCDSFGCHYADSRVFNDLIEGDFTPAYKYYFDCIIGPFKRPYMVNALEKIKGLDIEFVGNGHGPVLRSGVQKYFDMYRTWCRPEQRPEKVVAVAYVSAYGYTRRLAEHIRDGLKEGGVRVEMYDLVSDDTAAAKAAVAAADGFLLGSPTLVGDALPPVYEMFLGLNPIIHKGKPAGAFGSYGWSGEALALINGELKDAGFDVVDEGRRINWVPDEAALDEMRAYGRILAAKFQS